MKIATFNVNGVNGRLSSLLAWLHESAPDVACLQEIKAPDRAFPVEALRRAGYHAAFRGQRGHHGVAILARGSEPIVTRRSLPGEPEDRESRYLEAAVQGVLIGCLYAPNGNPHPGPKFDYKLRWLARLVAHARELAAAHVPVILVGDYNVVPDDRDLYSARSSWRADALLHPAARRLYAALLEEGYSDALRQLHPEAPLYTFWDYKRDAWRGNRGLRIDHLLLSGACAGRLVSAGVDVHVRGRPGASDHAPAWIILR